MINLCVEFGNIFGITFNPQTSNCIAFHLISKNSFCPRTNLNLNGHSLDWVNKSRYLGINVTNSLNCIFDVNKQLTKCYSYVHSILMLCGSTNEFVLLKFENQVCIDSILWN